MRNRAGTLLQIWQAVAHFYSFIDRQSRARMLTEILNNSELLSTFKLDSNFLFLAHL